MKSPTLDPRVTWAVAHMQRSFAEPIAIGDLASAVHLSVSRFTHLFVAQTGVPPARYLQCLRLRRAGLLIERTFLSVKEVMALVGYSDPSHFSRDFKRRHGVAPSDLRERTRSSPLRTTLEVPGPDAELGAGTAVHQAQADRPTDSRSHQVTRRRRTARCA